MENAAFRSHESLAMRFSTRPALVQVRSLDPPVGARPPPDSEASPEAKREISYGGSRQWLTLDGRLLVESADLRHMVTEDVTILEATAKSAQTKKNAQESRR